MRISGYMLIAILLGTASYAQEPPDMLHVIDAGYAEIASFTSDNPAGELWDGAPTFTYTGQINLSSFHWLGPRFSYVDYKLDAGDFLFRETGNARHLEIAAIYRLMSAKSTLIAPFFETGIGVSIREIRVTTSKFGGLVEQTDRIKDTRPVLNIGGGVII